MEKEILEEPKIRYGNSEEAFTWTLIRDFHKFLKERKKFSSFIKTHKQYDKKLLNDKHKVRDFLHYGFSYPNLKNINFDHLSASSIFKNAKDCPVHAFYSNILFKRFVLLLLLDRSVRDNTDYNKHHYFSMLADEFIIEELRKKCKKVYPNELQFSVWFGTAFTILGMLLILFFMGWIFGIETSMVMSTIILTLSIMFYFQIK